MHEFLKLMMIGLGGFLGAISRYSVGSLMFYRFGDSFAWGTLAVNVIGCFLMGSLIGAGLGANHRFFVFFGVGFLGSLTTFSAFSADTLRAISSGKYSLALLNVAANMFLALAAAWLGMMASRAFIGETDGA